MPHVVDWTSLAETETGPGVTRRVLDGTGASLVMVRVAAGISAPRHDHPHEQFVQVVSGHGTLETAEGARAFGPGTLFHFPPNTWHQARFDADTVLIETNLAP